MLDGFTKILGHDQDPLNAYIIAFSAHPPLLKAIATYGSPEKISLIAIVTIVGGTVGGYLTFSGAHRLLDAGITGKQNLGKINQSAISGILISTTMRFILFLAAVGVLRRVLFSTMTILLRVYFNLQPGKPD